jgi:aminopeptidase
MDDRIRRHAEILVDHCTDVNADDNVLVKAPTAAEDLVVALYEQLGKRGARPITAWTSRRAGAAYAREMDEADFRTKDHRLAAMEETDVVIMIAGPGNTAESADIDPEKGAAASRAREPILQERLDTRWVITRHPTQADAQRARMSTPDWQETVYEAIDHDWAAQREFQAQLAERLEDASEVRVVASDTDLSLSVEGMGALNDDGTENMPGGEVATVPVPGSVEGQVTFDVPITHRGRELEDVRLVFEDGEVVEYSAEQNEDLLAEILDTDEGASRVGELGIGMNRGIDQPTGNVLFDEKMGDTVHVALGDALDECVPDNREANQSATHVDLIVDMSKDSRIELDGEIVQRDGIFAFKGKNFSDTETV